ncbi:MAG TPA: WYL domain-containing protein [Trebonia sp.]|nr:WYL domain-containing protein [Trebonia sp.]
MTGKARRGAGPGAPRVVTSAERLRRLLALVPYVASRKVVSLAETAATFGVTERELIDDLNLAWCMELKEPQPYCPIDLSYEGGEIVIAQAEALDRPLRLAADEANALLMALRMLADMTRERDDAQPSRQFPVESVIAKLEAAASGLTAPPSRLAVVGAGDDREMAERLGTALAEGHRVRMRYYVPGRDEATERDVDPMRLLAVDGRTYLEGWCHRAEGVRLFRLDRVLDLTVLDEPSRVPESAEPVDVDAGLFRPSPTDVLVVLDVSPVARWVAEYYPCESVTPAPDGPEGWTRVSLRTPDTGWVARLALRLGGDGRVISPPELQAEVRQSARAALAQY